MPSLCCQLYRWNPICTYFCMWNICNKKLHEFNVLRKKPAFSSWYFKEAVLCGQVNNTIANAHFLNNDCFILCTSNYRMAAIKRTAVNQITFLAKQLQISSGVLKCCAVLLKRGTAIIMETGPSVRNKASACFGGRSAQVQSLAVPVGLGRFHVQKSRRATASHYRQYWAGCCDQIEGKLMSLTCSINVIVVLHVKPTISY